MKILLMNYEYPPLGGGGGIAHQDIAEALAPRHDILVLTTHFRGLPMTETRRGVQIRRVPVWGRTDLSTATLRSMVSFTPAAFVAGLRIIRNFQPKVIHAIFAVPSGLPAVALGKVTGVPVVLTLVGADVFDPDPTAGIATHRQPVVRAVVRRVIRAADALTAISRDTRLRAIDYHDAPSTLEVIPLGLVPPPGAPLGFASRIRRAGVPKESLRDSAGCPRGAPPSGFLVKPEPRRSPPTNEARPTGGPLRLITIGRLIPRKAYHDLLAALAELPERTVTLDLVGDGPLAADLRRTADDLGIADRVSFHRGVSDTRKWELLMQADCFVSSSLYEGFGIVFLEAMAAGLPIIATDTGGQTDYLNQGENALLVPPRQPAQLAAALAWMVRDASLRGRMAEANLRKVQSFPIEETAGRYERLFQRVVEQQRALRDAHATKAVLDPARDT